LAAGDKPNRPPLAAIFIGKMTRLRVGCTPLIAKFQEERDGGVARCTPETPYPSHVHGMDLGGGDASGGLYAGSSSVIKVHGNGEDGGGLHASSSGRVTVHGDVDGGLASSWR
jgi:hypothetical protein